jgi:hypothetical protein
MQIDKPNRNEEIAPLHRGVEQSLKAFERGGRLPISDRYGVTVQVAADFIGISRSRIYELLSGGELEGKIIHGRRIVIVESMLRMLGQAPGTTRATAA